MIRRLTFLAGILLLAGAHAPLPVSGQGSSCPNIGFDNGNFSNWSGGVGWCCPISVSGTALQAGRHTIMSGSGTDPNTGGAIPVVAPGGGPYSARLGNEQTGGEAERLSYSMVVDPMNTLFVYRYAVVLEDPDHYDSEQPRFQIRMFDQSGNNIDCGMYNVFATSGIPGFNTYVNSWGDLVVYKNWTTVGMDLTAYIGQLVTIEFATGDCSLGGHFGYAYIDCYCSPLTLSSNFCPGLVTTTLTAPEGFESYLWSTGETTSSITVTAPSTGDTFSCELTSVTGCSASLSTTLSPSIVQAAFNTTGDCMNAVQFHDGSVVASGPPIVAWHWDFGDGGTSNVQHPLHEFSQGGEHLVQLAVQSGAGCLDTVQQPVTLLPAPIADFSHNAVCLGEPVFFEDATTSGTPVAWLSWDFGDGSAGSSSTNPQHTYSSGGGFDVSLIVLGANGCSDTLVSQIQVGTIPVVDLGPDIWQCEGASVSVDAGNPGMTHQWSTGDGGQAISPTASGDYSVVVTNAAGCQGLDTIYVHFDPLPLSQLDDVTQCMDFPLVLDVESPGCTYQWSTGATTPSIVVPQVGGTYSVTVTTGHDCTVDLHSVVTYAPSIPLDLGPDQGLCLGEEVVLDPGFFPGATYAWSTGSTDQVATFTNTAVVWLHVTNGYCNASDTVVLLFDPLPVINIHDTTLCISNTLVLDAGHPHSAHLWSTGETTQVIEVAEQSGLYGVTVTAPSGCQGHKDIEVTFAPALWVELGRDSVLCEGDVLVLDAGEAPNYLWSTGNPTRYETVTEDADIWVWLNNGYCHAWDSIRLRFIAYPLHAPELEVKACFEDPWAVAVLEGSPTGTFYMWGTGEDTRTIQVDTYGEYTTWAMNPPRCVTEDIIRVVEFCPPRVFVPNTFTPNNDGFNEFFGPSSYDVISVEFVIFNRWGEILYTSGAQDPRWDGRRGGTMVQDGVYVWQYTYDPILPNGQLGHRKTVYGHVTLLR